jgi:hypothetical protein
MTDERQTDPELNAILGRLRTLPAEADLARWKARLRAARTNRRSSRHDWLRLAFAMAAGLAIGSTLMTRSSSPPACTIKSAKNFTVHATSSRVNIRLD